MSIEKKLNRRLELLKELRELNSELEVVENKLYSFEGVTCYIEDITSDVTKLELLTVNGSKQTFRNGSNCMFVEVKEFEEKAVIVSK